MKKRVLWLAPAILAAAFLLSAFGGGNNSHYPSGSPGGYTGSPGDGHNCTACHGGSASNVTGYITSNIPADGYVPGTTYTITCSSTGSGNKGFECSPQSVSGALLGTVSAGSGNHLCNGNKAVTHSSAVGGSSATWTFSWVAPAAGTGAVTFYGAFVISKPVIKLCTLVVNESVAVPLSATATAAPSTICAGQSTQLGVNVAGGNPPYTYAWTSVPAGFTSALQAPSASPVVTTTYSVQVGDGSSSVSSSVTVTVNQEPVVAAGIDTTVCKDDLHIPLHGTASNSASVAWTTSGDGTFSTTTALNSIYNPGTGDHTTGYVDLTLTASPVAPCETPVASVRHILFDPCTGISGTQGELSGILISPNPTSGLIYLNGLKNQDVNVTIYNNQGVQTLSRKISGTGNSAVMLDLSGLAKGIYYIKVQSAELVNIQKVILY